MDSHSIMVHNVCAGYGGNDVLVDVNLYCRPGTWVGLLGKNGCGKSTLLKAVTGQICLKKGSVVIDGFDIRLDPMGARNHFGYALDASELPSELTGRQFLELLASIRKANLEGSLIHLMDAFGIQPWLDKLIASYSYGTKKKLGVLGALIGYPPVLVLDESINGLDQVSSWSLKKVLDDLIQNKGKTIIMATHVMDIIYDSCTDIAVLHNGNIAENISMTDVRSNGCDRVSFERRIMGILTGRTQPLTAVASVQAPAQAFPLLIIHDPQHSVAGSESGTE